MTPFVDGDNRTPTGDNSLVVWVPLPPPLRLLPAARPPAAAGLLPGNVVAEAIALLVPRTSVPEKLGLSPAVSCLALRGDSTATTYSLGVGLYRPDELPPPPLPNWSLRPVPQPGGAEAILAVGGGTMSPAAATCDDGGVSRVPVLLVVACGVRSMLRKTQERSKRSGSSCV